MMEENPELIGTVTSDYHTRLRDEIAIRAMVVILEAHEHGTSAAVSQVSQDAYTMADAMLKARSQQPQPDHSVSKPE